MNTVKFSFCEWSKQNRTLRLSREYGLETRPFFFVESDRTGRKIKFVPVQPGDLDYDEDGYDGEISVYKPVEACGVARFVTYNEY